MYGIHDQALAWIMSYLSDRRQRVNIKVALSDKQELHILVFHRVLFSNRFCTACMLNFCLTSSTFWDYYTMHMLITHNSMLQLKKKISVEKLYDIEQCESDIKVWMNH